MTGEEAVPRRARPEIGAYACSRRLGRGGDAEVWAAAEPLTGCPVAIKVLRPERASAGQVPRLLREYQFLRDLALDGVPRVRGVGVTPGGQHYLVMDRLDGLPSARWVERATTPRDRVARTLGVLARAAWTVAAIHEAGVLHGDLKPSSVLVGEGDRVCLIDFGAARPSDPNRLVGTIPQAFMTRTFAAPELLSRHAPCAGSDVWALSAIACRLLLGAPPFGQGTRAELRARMTAGAIDALRTALVGSVPPRALDAIMAGFSREPGARPSADAWAEAVGGAARASDGRGPRCARAARPTPMELADTSEPGPRDDARGDGAVIAARARALLDAGAWSEARRLLWTREKRSDDPLVRARLLLVLAELEIGLGHFAVAADAVALVRGAVEALALAATSEVALRTLAVELQLAIALARPAPLEAAARSLDALPRQHELWAPLASGLALALADAGEVPLAQMWAERALDASAALDDPRPALWARAGAAVVAAVAGRSAPPAASDGLEARAASHGLWPALVRLALARADDEAAWRHCAHMLADLEPPESLPLRLSPWAVAVAARPAR